MSGNFLRGRVVAESESLLVELCIPVTYSWLAPMGGAFVTYGWTPSAWMTYYCHQELAIPWVAANVGWLTKDILVCHSTYYSYRLKYLTKPSRCCGGRASIRWSLLHYKGYDAIDETPGISTAASITLYLGHIQLQAIKWLRISTKGCSCENYL